MTVHFGKEAVVLNSLLRLWSYLWPLRRRLAISLVAALGAASLWAMTLMLAFPIVKVLLENQSLTEYVQSEIQKSQETELRLSAEIDDLEQKIAAISVTSPVSWQNDAVRWKHEQAQLRSKLKDNSRKYAQWTGVQQWIIPWLPVDRFAEFATILLCLAAMTILKGCCEYAQEILVGGAVERTLMQIRERLFRSTLQLDCQTLALEGTPQLMSRFTFDLSQLSQGLNLFGSKLVVELLKVVTCLSSAFFVNWRLTLLSMLCVPVAGALLQALGKRLKRSSRKQMETMSELYQVLEETLSSFRIMQAYGNERLHRHRFHLSGKAYFRRAVQILRLDAMSRPSLEFLATGAVFLALAPGAYLVLRGKTSIWGVPLAGEQFDRAELLLLYTLLAGMLDPVRKLSSVFSRLKKASAAAERVFQLMDQTSLIHEPKHPANFPRHQKSIELDRVSFRYASRNEDQQTRPCALDNVSLKIPFGSIVAVVGGNGSGKSTLVQLLLRFFDPHAGTVRIDGVDLKTVGLRELRAQIGYVSQETLLSDGTIADNIRYGSPFASQADIEEAARRAYVSTFAATLPLNLQTPVGERGGRLSGGQRQRIALARALVCNPTLMILDEATSAIDAQSEQLIYRSLKEFTQGRTTFVITHSMTPELLEFVSTIIVMDHGQIIASGPHDILLKTCPVYQRLSQAPRFLRAA